MIRTRLPAILLAAGLALTLSAAPAAAWEPETTHAGLAEQAALASRLHKRLVTLGFTGGLFEQLTIPPLDAPALLAALKLLRPDRLKIDRSFVRDLPASADAARREAGAASPAGARQRLHRLAGKACRSSSG